ncbi:oligopeptide/dipeptide ABC transporter ATP-binding protein [Streptomyces sp. V3I8]|nr:oligopeptide/dipeptide ABC transporter ATP-binding protein [Streptomyces sp. V3I8]
MGRPRLRQLVLNPDPDFVLSVHTCAALPATPEDVGATDNFACAKEYAAPRRADIVKRMESRLRPRAELGLSALVVTHDPGLARNIADRVAVMYLGRIIETGPVEDVLRAPRHPCTPALSSVLPDAPGDPVVLGGELPDPSRIPAGCRFHARCQILADGEADRAEVAGACRTQDLSLLNGTGEAQVACHRAASL